MLLTWRIDGEELVTDQPSAPNEERTRFRFEGPNFHFGVRRDRQWLRTLAAAYRYGDRDDTVLTFDA